MRDHVLIKKNKALFFAVYNELFWLWNGLV